MFIPVKWSDKIEELLPKIERALLNYKKISLVGTIQHAHEFEKIVRFLRGKGKEVILKIGRHSNVPGQVLGCDVAAVDKNVDVVLYIGSGKFHPLGIAYETGKKVIVANPINEEVYEISRREVENYRRKRYVAIGLTKAANRIGILVSTKYGQMNLKEAIEAKKILEEKGKEVFIFLFDTLQMNIINNFQDIEAWVNTACPRIVDDFEMIDVPIVNWSELKKEI